MKNVRIYEAGTFDAERIARDLVEAHGGVAYYHPGALYLTHVLRGREVCYHLAYEYAEQVCATRAYVRDVLRECGVIYNIDALGWTYYSISRSLLESFLDPYPVDYRIVDFIEPPGAPKSYVWFERTKAKRAAQVDVISAYARALELAGGWGLTLTRSDDEDTLMAHVYATEFNAVWRRLVADKPLRVALMGAALSPLYSPASHRGVRFCCSDDESRVRMQDAKFPRARWAHGWCVSLVARAAVYELMQLVHEELDCYAVLTDSVIVPDAEAALAFFERHSFPARIVAEGDFEILAPNVFRCGDKLTRNYDVHSGLLRRLDEAQDAAGFLDLGVRLPPEREIIALRLLTNAQNVVSYQ